jgi:sugar-phosphatase
MDHPPLPSADAHAGRPVGAAIFDLDGLLIDSEPFWRRAEIEVFGSVGLHLSETDVRQTMGLRIDDAVRHWWDRHPWEGASRQEVEQACTARVAELIVAEGAPMPGALEVVGLFRSLGLPMAVCSGSYAVVIEAALDTLGIAGDMTVWHSAEWEPTGKPHPSVYLTTAAELGVDPVACWAFEDSFNGAIAAKAARMRVVAVPEPDAAGSPRWGFCDLVLESLTAFDEGVLRRLEDPAA